MSEPSRPPGGCLTDAQIAEVQRAAPGHAPADLARHLAACELCQSRALFGAGHSARRKTPMPELPSLERAILLTALLLGAMLVFFWSLWKLTGRIQ